jgi:predicted  nucleic acid-binding Zn-ribbon protein
LVKTWVTRGGKHSDKIRNLEEEIESLEKKESELKAELASVQETIFEKQNLFRELQDEQAKQDLLD